MLALDSNRWATLHHCDGDGRDVPSMLKRIANAKQDSDFQTALDDLMSVLWHQCDYCSAATASAPHLGSLASKLEDDSQRSHMVASIALIEIARQQYIRNQTRFGNGGNDDVTPSDLAPAYHEAISSIAQLVSLTDTKLLSDGDRQRYDGSMLVATGDWESGWDMIANADKAVG